MHYERLCTIDPLDKSSCLLFSYNFPIRVQEVGSVSQAANRKPCTSFTFNRELKHETFLSHERQPEMILKNKVTSQFTDLR